MTDNGQGAKLKPIREGIDQMHAIACFALADLGPQPPVHGFGERPIAHANVEVPGSDSAAARRGRAGLLAGPAPHRRLGLGSHCG